MYRFVAAILCTALLAACASGEPPPAQTPVVVAAVPARTPALPASSTPTLQPLPPPDPEPASTAPFESQVPADAAAQMPLTPPFVVRSAMILPGNSAPQDPFGGDTVMLFDTVVQCEQAAAANAPTNLTLTLRWQVGGKMQFTQFTLHNGVATSYKGAIEVLAAPKTKRAKGKIRLEHLADGNVEGGEVVAIWCG